MLRGQSSRASIWVFVFLALVLPAATGAGPPAVVGTSTPVGPNETALLVGQGLDAGCKIEVGRLADSPCSAPAKAAATTPRRSGEPPTMTGFPANSGRSRASTDA